MGYYWRMCWQCTKATARGWIVIDSETPASWIWWIYTGLCKEDAEFKKTVCNWSRRVTEAGDRFLCLENQPTKSTGRGCTVKCKSTTQKFSLWKQIQIGTTMQTEMISVFHLNECSQILWFYCTSQQNKTEKQSSNRSNLVILHWLFGGKKKVLECPHYLSEAFLLRCTEERNRCSWTHGLANARMASSGPVMSLTSEWSLTSSGQSYVKWFVHASVGGHTAQEVLTAESCFPRPAAASITRTHRLLFQRLWFIL